MWSERAVTGGWKRGHNDPRQPGRQQRKKPYMASSEMGWNSHWGRWVNLSILRVSMASL